MPIPIIPALFAALSTAGTAAAGAGTAGTIAAGAGAAGAGALGAAAAKKGGSDLFKRLMLQQMMSGKAGTEGKPEEQMPGQVPTLPSMTARLPLGNEMTPPNLQAALFRAQGGGF